MSPLQWHDLAWSLHRTPKKVLEALKARPAQAFIAGGFIRSCVANEEVNDVDLFVPSADAAKELANAVAPEQDRAKNDKGLLPGIHATDNAYTITSLKPVVQIIHRWNFENASDLVSSFDFTIAQAVIWYEGDKWQSMTSDRFYADLASKRLIYGSPVRIEEAGGSMLRVLKFYQRDYRIPLDSLGAVIARLVSSIEMEKITGDDASREQQIAKVLTGLLREVDPNVDPTHIAHLPSESEAQL